MPKRMRSINASYDRSFRSVFTLGVIHIVRTYQTGGGTIKKRSNVRRGPRINFFITCYMYNSLSH
jgi:hypothetical protein